MDKDVLPWEMSICEVEECGGKAYGVQYPRDLLEKIRGLDVASKYPNRRGKHCCCKHGGPDKGEPIIFQDGFSEEGYPMYSGVDNGFVCFMESEVYYSEDSEEVYREVMLRTGGKK